MPLEWDGVKMYDLETLPYFDFVATRASVFHKHIMFFTSLKEEFVINFQYDEVI